MSERQLHETLFELLQQDQYTPEDAAEALLLGVEVIVHAAFTGELPAKFIAHEVISIRRDDLLDWMMATDVQAYAARLHQKV